MNYVIYNIRRKGNFVANFSVDFFKEDDGTKPVGIFIRSLDLKMKAKVIADLHLLEEYGT